VEHFGDNGSVLDLGLGADLYKFILFYFIIFWGKNESILL
jgi:hypothetical protein